MDGVNDPSLDREIESLLTVEPSPEFVARVRARVADEPEPGRWRTAWLFALAGAVAVVIGALVVWPSNEPASSISVPAPGPRVAQAVETVTPQPTSPAPQAVGRTSRVQAVPVTAARGRGSAIDLPEVVIAQNEVAAYTSLVASIRQRRFDTAVPVAPDPNQPLEVKALPPVEPIEIEPIVKLAGLE